MSAFLWTVIAALCRSEPARDGRKSTAGCQVSNVIINDHREQARSYKGVFDRYLINRQVNGYR
ncbi:hypothetical protein D3C87_1900400 [compost metagenome]